MFICEKCEGVGYHKQGCPDYPMTTTPPPEGTTEPLKRGQEFYAAGLGLFLTVIRVARDATWADVFVAQPATGATWSKRQRLIDGAFPFTAREVTR